MGLSRSEHDRAIALAISELAEAAGLPADDEKCPGTTALRRLAAEYRAALEWERTEHSRIEAQKTAGRSTQAGRDRVPTRVWTRGREPPSPASSLPGRASHAASRSRARSMTYETRPGGRQAEAKRSTTKARTVGTRARSGRGGRRRSDRARRQGEDQAQSEAGEAMTVDERRFLHTGPERRSRSCEFRLVDAYSQRAAGATSTDGWTLSAYAALTGQDYTVVDKHGSFQETLHRARSETLWRKVRACIS